MAVWNSLNQDRGQQRPSEDSQQDLISITKNRKGIGRTLRTVADKNNEAVHERKPIRMISPISSSNFAPAVSQSAPAPPPRSTTSTAPQDTVHISKQAQAAGDVDHDGDSH